MSIGEQYHEFLARLKKEHAELSGRIDALTLFLQRDTSSVVSVAHKDMLTGQLYAMKLYHHFLAMRLKDLGTRFIIERKTTAVASKDINQEVGIPVGVGRHDIDRDGPIPFDG